MVLQECFSACKCNDSRMEKHVPSFINYSLLFVFVVGEKSNHPLSPDFVPSVFTHITSPKKRRAEQSLVSFNRRQELKQRKQDAERQTTAVSALLDLCKSAAVSTSVDNVAAFDVGDNDVIDTPVVDTYINPATDFMVATPVDNNIDEGTGGTVATPACLLTCLVCLRRRTRSITNERSPGCSILRCCHGIAQGQLGVIDDLVGPAEWWTSSWAVPC